MTDLLIKNGHVIDPASGFEGRSDILVSDGVIKNIGNIRRPRVETIDASNMIVMPGLIDMHTHLREPGDEQKETIRTGSAAAAAGGFTSIVCMANTNPVNDCAMVTRFIKSQIEREAVVNVYPVGAATRGLKGVELADIGEMAEYGIVAVSDDGHAIRSANVMRKALEYSKTFGLPLISHAEDPELQREGIGVNEGVVATRLGLHGVPNAAEAIMIARDLALASLTGARLHIAHLSTKEGVELLQTAKRRGIPVTCEVTPHHLVLTEDEIIGYRTDAKVSPPLRTTADQKALVSALKKGIIDVIATDHAPHDSTEKEVSFEDASPGMVGLETALPIVWDLAKKAGIPARHLVARLTCNPASILLKNKGRLEVGADADITIFDPKRDWIVKKETLHSKSCNTPFLGRTMHGRVIKTIVGGKIVYEDGG